MKSFLGSSQADKEQRHSDRQKLEALVRRLLPVPEESYLHIQELACQEENCPPLETVLILFHEGGKREQYRWHKALSEVQESDIRELLQSSAELGGERA